MAKTAIAQAEHGQLTAQNEMLIDEVTQNSERLTAVQAELAEAQRELAQLKREQSKAPSNQSTEQSMDDDIDARREQLKTLLDDPTVQMTQAEMAAKLGVSISTVRRDLHSLNGQVS
jgi:response regulator of citrate/malate metabolism